MSGMSECMLECQHFLHLLKQHICKSLIRFLRGAVNVQWRLDFLKQEGGYCGEFGGELGGKLRMEGNLEGNLEGKLEGNLEGNLQGNLQIT